MTQPRLILISLAAGILGVFLALTAWHLYEDHVLVDTARSAARARPVTEAQK